MRIAFVSRRYWPAVSGMSVYAQNLLTELASRGHDLVMVSQYRGDDEGTRVYGGGPPPPLPGVDVRGMEALGEQAVADDRPADFEADVAALVDAVAAAHAEAPFDLLHAQYGYPPGLAVLEAGRRLGVPTVVSIQGGDGHWVGRCCTTHRDAMRTVLDHSGAVLVGSDSFAAEVVDNHGVDPARLTVVGGATDTGAFSPSRPLGSLSDPPTLVYHGRVDARKGVLELLDALALLRAGGRDIRLLVSGIGPDSDAVAHRSAEPDLRGAVELSGYVGYASAPDVYRRGDVFVSPTWSEGFSNTILEAMATGLPVVSCRSVGVVDCLRDGENGLLVEPHDVAGLAAAVARLLDDQPLRTRLATVALEEVRTLWSWPALTSKVEEVYASLAGTTPSVDWEAPAPPDLSCRYRRAPHLL